MANLSVVIAFFAVIALSSATLPLKKEEAILGSDSHNYFNCPNPTRATTLLLDEPVSTEGRWFATQTRTVQFPGDIINTQRITCINIKDLDANGNGGYPILVDGGVGNFHATIRLVTQRGKGMHFRVQIYAA